MSEFLRGVGRRSYRWRWGSADVGRPTWRLLEEVGEEQGVRGEETTAEESSRPKGGNRTAGKGRGDRVTGGCRRGRRSSQCQEAGRRQRGRRREGDGVEAFSPNLLGLGPG